MNPSAPSLDRRSFLAAGAAVGAAGAGLALGVAPMSKTLAAEAAAPLFTISVAEWSFHKALHDKKTMTNLDFPKVVKEQVGVDAVEYVNQFFMDKAKDMAYLGELKQRCDDLGVTSVLIMCDGEGALGDPDEAKRNQAVDNHKKWCEAAKFLGCHSIRVNAQSSGAKAKQAVLAADGLRKLSEWAAPLGLGVIVENHGGWSSDGAWLAGVMKDVNLPNCGTLPDFGNFNIGPDQKYDRYKGVEELMPFAKGVSAKSYRFDAEGNEVDMDYPRLLKIVLDAGYHGRVGIEWEGSVPEDELQGVILTKKLLEKVRDQLAQQS